MHREQRPRLLALAPPVLEVHCSCSAELARSRCDARQRHPCHFDDEILADSWDDWVATDAEPLGAGPILHVDTTHPADITRVTQWVRYRA